MLEKTLNTFPQADQIQLGELFEKANKRNSLKNQAIAALVIIAIAAILGPVLEIKERKTPVNSNPTPTTIFVSPINEVESVHPPTLTTLPK